MENFSYNKLSYAVALALASLGTAPYAAAQQVVPTVGASANAEVAQVLVVGTRASQQSAIDRKKNASTAVDSIIAEDIGAFPDRNVGEAISRIAGVALDRGDYGEGMNVSVRGNGPDLTRVEIDGMGVVAAGGSDLNGGGNGRGVELRELPSDLIKSVDIIKGSTAAMTEGSLGGGVQINTRTGLDFKSRFMSARVSGSKNTINNKWGPDLNLIFADKFLEGRLGVVATLNKSKMYNENHRQEVVTSGSAGYARAWDFDNSPEKTFSYNPDTLSRTDPIVDQTTETRSPFAFTPRQIVTMAANAKSKADCMTAFPLLTAPEANTITNTTNRNVAINHRVNELNSCLAQWNDYTPSLIRSQMKRQEDDRSSADVRFDYKVNSNLSVFTKINRQKRTIGDDFLTLNLGGFGGSGSTVQPGYSGPTYTENETTLTRTAVPGSGYYVTPGYNGRTNLFPTSGVVVNTNPATVVVDNTHHVTRATIADGAVSTDQIRDNIETKNNYLQLGGTYRNSGFKADFFVSKATSEWSRIQKRTSFNFNYGAVELEALPNGLWGYNFPASFNQNNPDAYSWIVPASRNRTQVAATINNPLIPAATIAQLPRTNSPDPNVATAPQLQYTPRLAESGEKQFKLDMSYALSDKVPLFTTLKFGVNGREVKDQKWNAGGYVAQSATGEFGKAGYVPPIVVPTNNLRGRLYACENTPGSLAPGGSPCAYGYNQSTNLSNTREGNIYLTQAQYRDLIAQSMTKQTERFFNGAKDRQEGIVDGWTEIDIDKAFELAGVKNLNTDCMKECTGSDGKVYRQPVNQLEEKVQAAYLMGEFGFDTIPFTERALPFGITVDGNWGVRYVRTEVNGTGLFRFDSVVGAGAGTQTVQFNRVVTLNRKTTDILPSFNSSVWLIPDQLNFRYNWAKTLARPPVDRLLPSGNCVINNMLGDEAEFSCGGRIGNPALEPQQNKNQNFSIEWYPNKDTMVSLAHFRQKGIVGANVNTQQNNSKLFGGTDITDPITGRLLGNLSFTVPTYENGPTTARNGWEFASKTAFTFLPWVLRYTGADVNYTKIKAVNLNSAVRDIISGDVLPVVNEPKHQYNLSLWYDDGALSARVAWQVVAERFSCIAACGANTVNNVPAEGAARNNVLPYNPGFPNYNSETRYIDAKVAYKFKNGIELFADVRNLGKQTISGTQGKYGRFESGAPSMLYYAYAGARISAGMTVRFGGQ